MARQMKDSGVEWIGEIPEAWSKDKICRVCSLIGSGTTPKFDRFDLSSATIPWIQSGDLSTAHIHQVKACVTPDIIAEYSALKVYDAPFIVVAMYGASIGNTSISVINACVNQACCVLSLRTFSLRYMYYIIMACKPYFIYQGEGGGQPNISQEKIKQTRIPVPPPIEQQGITSYLDSKCAEIDKVVDQTRATIEQYKKLKLAIITEAVTKGVRGPRPMKPSGVEWIGDIPEEWEVKRIKYVLNNHDALRRPIAAENRSQKGDILYDYYGASGVIDQIDDYIIEGTYILIGEDGANLVLRNLPLVYVAKGKYWVNNHAHILSPKQGIEFDYIIHALESADYTTFITGTAQPKLSQGNLSQVSLPVPTTEEQQEIATYLDTKCAEIDRIIEKKEQLIEELGSYKKSLIYEYVTGKKEIKIHNYSQNTIC